MSYWCHNSKTRTMKQQWNCSSTVPSWNAQNFFVLGFTGMLLWVNVGYHSLEYLSVFVCFGCAIIKRAIKKYWRVENLRIWLYQWSHSFVVNRRLFLPVLVHQLYCHWKYSTTSACTCPYAERRFGKAECLRSCSEYRSRIHERTISLRFWA